ncbi:MAG: diacylglycerol kinase family protein [Oscillospiraceae bacterium]|nr:diacylglycerol kinase family protein [Oscillospiraceae bacterium]
MRALLKSFLYAFRGILAAVKTQRNMRIHLTAVVYVTAFSFFYDLTRTEYALLALTFGAVISFEMINTAVEAAVDISSPDYSENAGLAKDVAAGAVLVAAIFAVVVGVLLFGDIAVIKEIFRYYGSHPLALAGLICSFGAAWVFVFGLPKNKRDE